MSNILDEILDDKRNKIERLKSEVDLDELRSLAGRAETSDFINSLKTTDINLIAEIKPEAPSSGQLTTLDPEKIAWVYQEEEAVNAVSVLTDEPYFGMTLDDFRRARGIISKPILRKEFIIDEFQVYRSARAGADAVLLIASILNEEKIKNLRNLILDLGMQPLVEIHSMAEWENLPFTPELLGINNRTLEGDFSTNLSVTESIVQEIPEKVTIISESGINNYEDIQRLEETQKVDAVLVGTSILKSADAPESIRERVNSLRGFQ